MERENSINTISILGFIFAFFLSPVGLILSIIGLVKGNKLKKEEGVRPKYYAFSIVGLILSIFFILIILFILGFVFLVVGIATSFDEDVLGKYTCDYRYSSLPAVEAEFRNHKFKWGKYGDSKNFVSGTYNIISRKINNGEYEYELRLTPKNVKSTTKINTKDHYYIIIKQLDNKTTITFDNSTAYNCHKVGNN